MNQGTKKEAASLEGFLSWPVDTIVFYAVLFLVSLVVPGELKELKWTGQGCVEVGTGLNCHHRTHGRP